MRYKIKSFFYETSYIYTKETLFDFIEFQLIRNKFSDLFSDRFEFSHYRGFFVEDVKEVTNKDYDYFDTRIKKKYVTSLFIIEDEKGYTVDYRKIHSEYNESRGISPRNRSWKPKDRSTASYRSSVKSSRFNLQRNTYKKEYSSLCEVVDNCRPYRSKRLSIIRDAFVRHYDDEICRNKGSKNWKEIKIKKQWQKKQR